MICDSVMERFVHGLYPLIHIRRSRARGIRKGLVLFPFFSLFPRSLSLSLEVKTAETMGDAGASQEWGGPGGSLACVHRAIVHDDHER